MITRFPGVIAAVAFGTILAVEPPLAYPFTGSAGRPPLISFHHQPGLHRVCAPTVNGQVSPSRSWFASTRRDKCYLALVAGVPRNSAATSPKASLSSPCRPTRPFLWNGGLGKGLPPAHPGVTANSRSAQTCAPLMYGF
jgi:hypothetical protein